MKKIFLLLFLCAINGALFAQSIDEIINAQEVERIEKTLSADDMQGRKVFSPGIDKAADFIADEFKKIGLKTLSNLSSYRQEFLMVQPKLISVTATLDGKPLDAKNVVVVTTQAEVNVTQLSGFQQGSIAAGANIFEAAYDFMSDKKNYIVKVDTSLGKRFAALNNFKRNLMQSGKTVIFVLTPTTPTNFSIVATHDVSNTKKLANIAGMITGKKKPNEYVIFSGHYDHLGIGKPVKGDSIFNGANDDAAGTTAVIMLAKYFMKQAAPKRSIIFVAFTAEEVGGFGSQYFSEQLDPAQIMAMFNIEMIGTESKWGKNSAYITGYEKTDMGEILAKNLKGTDFTFYPDPYPSEQLFYRSDNATLARLGVPAHTISTSKMDNEPNYHKLSDEIGTLDMNNMAKIIKAIALSSRSIVKGKSSPSRVKPEDLK
jgi:Zn-dependent M28 family amino/carboxypeptidase